ITGNGWKKVAIPYTVTANTMLEFDFESSVQGEVHGIGFDTDDTISNPIQIFQLYGTQSWGLTAPAYGGGVQHYVINVGASFTGAMDFLTFANDDDGADAGESVFSNITIYEGP
ncbi:MAG: calcium-binding protein, partial [Chloroflexi bacterium]|nr:calcium-binding protein [Chloroflexota bacterium]